MRELIAPFRVIARLLSYVILHIVLYYVILYYFVILYRSPVRTYAFQRRQLGQDLLAAPDIRIVVDQPVYAGRVVVEPHSLATSVPTLLDINPPVLVDPQRHHGIQAVHRQIGVVALEFRLAPDRVTALRLSVTRFPPIRGRRPARGGRY